MAAGGAVFALCGLTVTLCRRMPGPARAAACAACAALLCAGLALAAPRLPEGAPACAAWCLVLPCTLLFLPRAGLRLATMQRSITGCGLACLLAALAVSAWCAVQVLRVQHAGPSFVLIVVDCLRPDHLGCYGCKRDTSPAIDALARVGRRYERAYAHSSWTKPSVASMFSSLPPARHGLVNPGQTAPDALLMLAEAMRNAGYTNLFINGGNVFLKKEFNLHQGFHYYDYLPQGSTSAADVARAFLSRVAGLGSAPYFAYVHFMDAHAPYTRNPHNTRYTEKIIDALAPGKPGTLLSLQREPDSPCGRDPALRQYFRDLYDGQVRCVDDAVGSIMQGLSLLGRLDDTLVIITADHGEEFWEHGSAEHGHTLYDELLHVPLIIAGSPIRHEVVAEPVQLIDLMPTVLDFAGIERGRLELQGVSLKPGGAALSPHRPLFASATLYGPESWCVVRDNAKLVYRTDDARGKWKLSGPQAPPGYQLFDLARDPAEQDDRAAGADLPPGLEDLLADYLRIRPLAVPEASVRVGDKDMRRQLESLGYVH